MFHPITSKCFRKLNWLHPHSTPKRSIFDKTLKCWCISPWAISSLIYKHSILDNDTNTLYAFVYYCMLQDPLSPYTVLIMVQISLKKRSSKKLDQKLTWEAFYKGKINYEYEKWCRWITAKLFKRFFFTCFPQKGFPGSKLTEK